MRRVHNLILLCMLLICQQHIVAQSYKLGKQKHSFSYESLYKHSSAVKKVTVVEKTTPKPVVKETPQSIVNETPKSVVKEVVEPVWNESDIEKASNEEIQKLQRAHQQLNQLCGQTIYDSNAFNIYCRLYKSAPQTKKNVQTLMKIQMVVLKYYSSRTTSYPDLEKRLKGASSLSEQKNILLSYSK